MKQFRRERLIHPSSLSCQVSLQRYLLVSGLVLLFMLSAFSQALALSQPYMVKDINALTTGTTSNAGQFVTIGAITYFTANDGINGQELWKTDGTEAGTVLVKDINPGSSSSNPTSLTDVNGTLFFVANDGVNGTELWKSDGTADGTVLVKDINPGSGSSSPAYLTVINGTLFFAANNGTNGVELWKSQGTSTSTVMVKDIWPGSSSSAPAYLTNLNGTLFFAATDGISGIELWKSDGTAAGTSEVKEYYSGGVSLSPKNITNVNGTLFFAATDIYGTELWKSDGTFAGTMAVKDINPSTGSSNPSNLTNVNGTLFFTANDGSHGIELWKSDGTTAGTVLVKDIYAGNTSSSPQYLTNVNGTLFFAATDNVNGPYLWKSDGTATGTVRVSWWAQSPSGLVNLNGTLLFSGFDGVNGIELMKSDGTTAGTSNVKDINAGSANSNPAGLTTSSGIIYFIADDGVHGTEIWKSDGTAAGTVMVKDISPATASSYSQYPVAMNGSLFFTASDGANGYELWKSDGTTSGTTMVKDIWPGSGGSGPAQYPVTINGTLFFAATDGKNGTELWKSDGTLAGTVMVKDIYPDSASSSPTYLTDVNGTLFFKANDGINGDELWKSDGTEAGTVMVKNINPNGANIAYLTNVNGLLFFVATDASGAELWKSDGTAAGTVMVKDILPGSGSSYPTNLTNINGTLYFGANDGTNGVELWKSDGTTAGTVMVKNIRDGSGSSYPSGFTNVNGILFFGADDGINGTELWKSDGTAAGTVMVADIFPGNASHPQYLTNLNGTLFFTANDGVNGAELWKSDGTAAGTVMVKDIWSGSIGSNPYNLTAVNGILFFTVNDGVKGTELWMSDGTNAGTVLVSDINPGSGSSNPAYLTNVNGNLFFEANDGLHGNELWALSTLPDIAANTTLVDFGATVVNTAVSSFIGISNTGYAPLTVTTPISIAGTGNAMFSIAPGGPNPCPNLTPTIPFGGSCSLAITYSPTAIGDHAAVVHIVSDAANMPNLDVPLTGRGIASSYTLALLFSGSGTGTVTGPGISCSTGSTTGCSSSFPSGTPVTLTATAASGSVFAGWDGPCSAVSINQCSIIMDAIQNVTFTFNKATSSDPEIVVSGTSDQWDMTSNSLGEVVWSQYDGVSSRQIYSSIRGQLTSGQADHYRPAINNLGDVVWSESSWDGMSSSSAIKGIIAGRAVQLASSSQFILSAVGINDKGEAVWTQWNGINTQVYSNVRGLLTSEPGTYDLPGINNLGDVVWDQRNSSYARQIYKLAAGSTTPVAVSAGFDCYGPAANDVGEVVWVQNVGGFLQLFSNVRGQMTFGDIGVPTSLKLDNCGGVLFSAWNNATGTTNIYRLGSNDPCVSYPGTNDSQAQASPVAFGNIFTGLADSATNPVDWYRFDAAAGDGIHITVNYDNRAPNLLNIGLYDGQGNLVSGPTAFNPLGIHTTATFSGTYYLKVESQGRRFGYAVSLSKYASNCGAGPCPEVVASGPLGMGASINSLGEVVWSQYDPATQQNQLYSSVRGQLSSDPVGHNSPAINNLGDLVWVEYTNGLPNYTLRGIIGGQPFTVTTSQSSINKVDINDRGEVVWDQYDNTNTWQIFSSIRGQLTSGAVNYNPSINNAGDVVFTKYDPALPGPAQIYRLAAGTTAPVAVTSDNLNHNNSAVNDGGEIIWAARDMNSPTATTQLVSSTRGVLVPSVADISGLDLSNCGDLVYTVFTPNGPVLYRLGSGASCMTPPARLFALAVGKAPAGTGTGQIVSAPAGISLKSTDGMVTAPFAAGTPVTLTAVPDGNSGFTGWGGACAGVSGTSCMVTMDGAKGVTAEFGALPVAPILVGPSGTIDTVTPTYTFNAVAGATGYSVRLQATTGSTDTVWYTPADAGCPGNTGICSIPQATPQVNGNYSWYARARNSSGTGPWSTYKNFTVAVSAAAPASITVPASSTTGNYTISWAASTTPGSTYVLQESTTSNFSTFTVVTSGLTGTSAVISGKTNGTYYYRAKAQASGIADSAWVSGNCVVSIPLPVAPTLVGPSGTIGTATPTYTFNAVAGATGYSVRLQATAGSTDTVWYTPADAGCPGNTGTCSIPQATPLANGQNYSWYARARNSTGNGPWSTYKNFTVAISAAAPATITVPASSTTGNYTVSWAASTTPGATYVLQESTTSTFSTFTVVTSGLTGTSAVISGKTNGTYYYRVKAQASGIADSAWVSGNCVVSIPLPVAPTLVSPSGTIGTNTPTYTFNAVAGATGYSVRLQATTGSTDTVWYTPADAGCPGNTGTCSIPQATPLVNGNYSWYARARNSSGTGPWSTYKNFTVQ